MVLSKSAKIMLSWVGIMVVGVSSFAFAKISVDKNRYEILKSKNRMKKLNEEIPDGEHVRYANIRK